MDFHILPVTPFQQNCTLIWCEATRRAAIIDPGGETERIQGAIARLDLIPERILLTHGHIDHVGAAAPLARALGLPILGPHADDAFLITGLRMQSQLFGLARVEDFTPDSWLRDGDVIEVGGLKLDVLHCPGHTPGHVVLVAAEARLAQVGDVLFRGSIGRTDFPRGDHGQLIDSIQQRLFPLGDDIRFIAGHGPMSTFGEERRANPFVRG